MQGVTHLCALLRYTTSLNTLRVDVASAEGAEAIARDLPANRSLMHITLGGPVPDGLLAAMSEILAANTVRRMHASPGAWLGGALGGCLGRQGGGERSGCVLRCRGWWCCGEGPVGRGMFCVWLRGRCG